MFDRFTNPAKELEPPVGYRVRYAHTPSCGARKMPKQAWRFPALLVRRTLGSHLERLHNIL